MAAPEPPPEAVSEAKYDRNDDNTNGCCPTYRPKVALCSCSASKTFEIHPEIGGEERQWKENDRDHCKDKDGFVIRLGEYGQLILFNGSELKKLREVKNESSEKWL